MPRLKTGEVASSVADKQAQKINNVLRIIHAFKLAQEQPQAAPEEVRAAFKSYRCLARWNSATLKIEPMSENTLRKHLGKLYEGGLINFERDRLRFLHGENKSQVRIGTKLAYKQSSDDFRLENQLLTNQILQFSAQYLDLLELVTDHSQSHSALKAALQAHLQKYPSTFRGFQLIQGGKDGR